MRPLERFRIRALVGASLLGQPATNTLHYAARCLGYAINMKAGADLDGVDTESWLANSRNAVIDLNVLPIRRAVLLADLDGFALLLACRAHTDATVRSLALQALDDELALYPLRDRLEELCEDASALNSLMPPREPVAPVNLDEIPY